MIGKEIRIETKTQKENIRDEILSCVSSFANSNQSGGLLVIGIDNSGKIKGVDHVDEGELNGILQILNSLKNHFTSSKEIICEDEYGTKKKLLLLYVGYSSNAICETNHASPKSWKRVGPRTEPLNDLEREQIKRDKKVVSYENSICCLYDESEIDKDLANEFKSYYLRERDARIEWTLEQVLSQAGAIVKQSDGKSYFTNAGYLFFASNPRKMIPCSHIRFLRYDAGVNENVNPGSANFDKDFDGPLPNLIRKVRNFVKEYAFLKVYKRRKEDGGFIDEPEYPYIVIDEAIVNAVAHREYALNNPIRCIAYRDSFVVLNPGNIPQNVPAEFSLNDVNLNSEPRNPKIVEWLRLMRDEQGAAFVRALSEGTKTMQSEMEKMSLPSPEYKTNGYTKLILHNNALEREAKYALEVETKSSEFANFFKLTFEKDFPGRSDKNKLKTVILMAIKDALANKGWFIDRSSFSRVVAHPRGMAFPLGTEVEKFTKIFQAYIFQIKYFGEDFYLVFDLKAELKNVLNLDDLIKQQINTIGKRALVGINSKWENGKIVEITGNSSKILLFDYDEIVEVQNKRVIPDLSKTDISNLLIKNKIRFDLNQKIKELSLASQVNATRQRAEKMQAAIYQVVDAISPMKINGKDISFSVQPEPLKLPRLKSIFDSIKPLTVFHDIPEPTVEFNRHNTDSDILSGLTKYGSYDNDPKNIEIVPICKSEDRSKLQDLIKRLEVGKYKFLGTERTFGVKINYNTIYTVNSYDDVENECRRLVGSNPTWAGDTSLSRIFLIHLPEDNYPEADKNSPYYSIKEYLFEVGIPCQMIDTPILNNPDWKDLNLALNLIAKCGKTPWVLPDELPDVDFFIGLSYTLHPDFKNSQKLMGFANVFNRYGRWHYYKGDAIFDFNERHKYFEQLVESSLKELSLGETPSLHFHYSSKFSKEDIQVILKAAQKIKPRGRFSFVWVNTDHTTRLYDSSTQSDGSLSRGGYVITTPNQFYLSTTGYNPYKKSLGTPKMLEINVHTEPFDPKQPTDLKLYAKQFLYLTKLNWASTQALCGEPITIKYAKDIARLTSIFIERKGIFKLHPALEKTPWFI